MATIKKSGIDTMYNEMTLEKAERILNELTDRFPEQAGRLSSEQLRAMALMILIREEQLQ